MSEDPVLKAKGARPNILAQKKVGIVLTEVEVGGMLARFFEARTAKANPVMPIAGSEGASGVSAMGIIGTGHPEPTSHLVPSVTKPYRFTVRALAEFDLAPKDSGKWAPYDEAKGRFLTFDEMQVMTPNQLLHERLTKN